MGSGGTEVPFNGGKPQGLITLQEAIAIVERVIVEARKGMMVDELIDIGASEMRLVLAAAKLMVEIHGMADRGELDGVDLEWMVAADTLIIGEDEACPN